MVVDIGDVNSHIKPKADSVLRNMRKDDLIKYIRRLEYIHNATVQDSKGVEIDPFKKWIPVTERLPELPVNKFENNIGGNENEVHK